MVPPVEALYRIRTRSTWQGSGSPLPTQKSEALRKAEGEAEAQNQVNWRNYGFQTTLNNIHISRPSLNAFVAEIGLAAPQLASLFPSSVAGGPGFTLTITGSNLDSGAVVLWNGMPLITTFINGTALQASVPSALTDVPGTVSVTVSEEGFTSNSLPFQRLDL